ncbi:ribonuclease R [Meinhardsimonia xiamenensis]|jgi:ribonuclease R|uniref:Ribonuclease R n=1 Tax=Meinhardsimonia xiamenensis TaxID=990712 RepID=A0A1G8XWS0_9RHOB|nr:ribonuclease R [Meinhardsimonia xiamenensis]PRX37051.1 ribonuclease R [Meinhardsimonia xiamenensis]SDJ94220.1 ribonuclease R [Meinhardsimonia xiamenensis]
MKALPTKEEILAWIAEHPTETNKRDIARAFGVKGQAKVELKRLLREMEDEGLLERRRKSYRDASRLPPVTVLEVTGADADGDLFARPLEWHGEGEPPRVLIAPGPGPAPGKGDRVLARLTPAKGEDHAYVAKVIRRIGQGPKRILGIFRKSAEGGRLVPIDKGVDREWLVPRDATHGARDGELVEAEASGRAGAYGLPRARVVARLGDPSQPKAFSLIAIHQYGIPDEFPPEVLEEAERLKPAGLKGREDLRDLPLITIDPADARDHDDAVFAEPDDDPKNPGGHVIWVAIADVAYYVRPGTALDREARRRGNSTYFPDRVVPMLPERLSGDLCSLHEGVPRACIAVRMVIDAKGHKRSHRFVRGLMRSAASLAYEEVQAAADGKPDDRTGPLMERVIAPLYAAYECAKKARAERQPLDLDLPERKIVLDEEGRVVSVGFRDRLEAHRLIEEFMILANVCAAEELFARRRPLLYRVHEEPSPEKLEALREIAEASGLTLAKGQVLHTRHLNQLLEQAEGTPHDELINMATLRAMMQAYYHPENFGHFGLALRSYAHFTSPIRRYADLIVHRALISAHGWGKDGLSEADIEHLEETAKHISETERRSMAAERDTADRYLAAFLADRVGAEFTGRITGVQRFGVFVRLDDTGAEGIIPVRALGREYFHYDPHLQALTGSESGAVFEIGQKVTVKLVEAAPVSGGLLFELVEAGAAGGRPAPRARGKGGRKAKAPVGRKPAKAARKGAKVRRKVTRTRR